MSETVITVQGAFSAWYPAERAVVSVIVQVDGAERDPVFARATAAAERLRASLIALHDAAAGPVTWWSSDSVRISSSRPWTHDGTLAPIVYAASVGFSARFGDFDALALWVESTAALDGVTIADIRWELTDATRVVATTEVRSRSVKDAVTKATVFAQSIGLASVTAIALADPGMLGDQAGGSTDPVRLMKADRMAAADGSPALTLKPEQIEVSSVVDARFVAR